jgi:hypothetical protein
MAKSKAKYSYVKDTAAGKAGKDHYNLDSAMKSSVETVPTYKKGGMSKGGNMQTVQVRGVGMARPRTAKIC